MIADARISPVSVPVGEVAVEGDVALVPEPSAVVIFAHGSGSSRHSVRNQAVARELQNAGIATLMMDLLTPEEERVDLVSAEHRFDVDLLTTRVSGAVAWWRSDGPLPSLPIGLFGASTGAAAALAAAARRPDAVGAVVSRGGRPDLAAEALSSVRAPTLLIVGGRDRQVIELNRRAMERLAAPVRLELVPGATHLFEEAGALEAVAALARDWFLEHLTAPGHGRAAVADRGS